MDRNVKTRAQEIGEEWLKDSSLGKWFPFTAQELERLKMERMKGNKIGESMPQQMTHVVFASTTLWPVNENDPRSGLEPASSWHLGWWNGNGWYDAGSHRIVKDVSHWLAIPPMPK
jgi:hypothetical protein